MRPFRIRRLLLWRLSSPRRVPDAAPRLRVQAHRWWFRALLSPSPPNGDRSRRPRNSSTIAGMLLLCPHHAPARCDYAVCWGTRLAKRTFEGVPEKEFTRPEAPARWQLDLQHLETSFPAIHRNSSVPGFYTSSFGGPGHPVRYCGAPDLDRPLDLRMERPCPYVGGKGPDQVVHLSNLPSPPYDLILIRNLRSISSMRTVLLDEGQGIRLEKIQTLDYSVSPDPSEKVGEFARVHFGWKDDGVLECDRACIQAFVHTHDGNAALGLPAHDGAFDGGCAAVFRQE